MSSIKLSPNASGTGIFTVAAPNSNTDRTLTLPDATGTVLAADGSGNVSVSGTVTATSFSGSGASLTGIPAPSALTTASGSAPSYSARAWVNFNGTGTVAIRASGNVSSITDNGTGYYTLNFSTAMPDANYSYLAKSTRSTNNTAASTDMNNSATCVDPTTSTLVVKTGFNQGVNSTEDSPNVTVAIFR